MCVCNVCVHIGFRDLLRKRNADIRRTDIPCDANTPPQPRGQGIKIKETLTDKVTLSHRVSQSSVLGPLLFASYTAPFSAIISSFDINHNLYADDIQIHMSLSSKESLREFATLSG